jgi:hypothetical protein
MFFPTRRRKSSPDGGFNVVDSSPTDGLVPVASGWQIDAISACGPSEPDGRTYSIVSSNGGISEPPPATSTSAAGWVRADQRQHMNEHRSTAESVPPQTLFLRQWMLTARRSIRFNANGRSFANVRYICDSALNKLSRTTARSISRLYPQDARRWRRRRRRSSGLGGSLRLYITARLPERESETRGKATHT